MVEGQAAPPSEVPEVSAVPPASTERRYATIKDSAADLKDPNKDRSRTLETFLASFSFCLNRFCQSVKTYKKYVKMKRQEKRRALREQRWSDYQQITFPGTEPEPETEWTEELLYTGDLYSGQPYQRAVEDSAVNKLVRDWDPRLLNPLVVSYRNDRYYLVDGQHRVCAML